MQKRKRTEPELRETSGQELPEEVSFLFFVRRRVTSLEFVTNFPTSQGFAMVRCVQLIHIREKLRKKVEIRFRKSGKPFEFRQLFRKNLHFSLIFHEILPL